MQSQPQPVGPPPRASFLSLPFELRDPIYRLFLRSLHYVKPMLYDPRTPIYCLQNLDPRPLFVHPQIQHDIEALLVFHTRIQIPARLSHNHESTLSAPTQQWLQDTGIEFKRVRVWSDLPVPITLDVDVLADREPAVKYRWRWRRGKWRLYSWQKIIIEPAVPIMLEYLAQKLRKGVEARGGTGVGIGEINLLMEGMERFHRWVAVHLELRSFNSRLAAASYEGKLAALRWSAGEKRDEFRRRLEWWDSVEAEVSELNPA